MLLAQKQHACVEEATVMKRLLSVNAAEMEKICFGHRSLEILNLPSLPPFHVYGWPLKLKDLGVKGFPGIGPGNISCKYRRAGQSQAFSTVMITNSQAQARPRGPGTGKAFKVVLNWGKAGWALCMPHTERRRCARAALGPDSSFLGDTRGKGSCYPGIRAALPRDGPLGPQWHARILNSAPALDLGQQCWPPLLHRTGKPCPGLCGPFWSPWLVPRL